MPADLLFRDRDQVRAALIESLRQWEKLPVQGRWLVNSHPKSGTFLPRNILMHFNGEQLHQQILFFNTFGDAMQGIEEPRIYTGHIPHSMFADATGTIGILDAVLLVRHPCGVALALARAFYDRNTERADHLQLRQQDSFNEIVRKIVCGYETAGRRFAPLASSLSEFTVEWFGYTRFTLKHEDILARLAGDDALLVAYFAPMLEALFGHVPADAAGRIRAGAAARISATYSRTAAWASQSPSPRDVYDLVPPAAAAGLRDIAALLGYAE